MNLMNLHWHIITIPCPLLTLAFTLGVVPSMSLGKCMLMCIHCYSILQSIFTFQKILCVLPVYPFPQPLTTTDLFTAFITLPFPECSVVGIIQYVEFSNWLLSLSDMPVFSRLDGSFPFSTEIVLHCLDVPHSLSSCQWRTSWFPSFDEKSGLIFIAFLLVCNALPFLDWFQDFLFILGFQECSLLTLKII